MIFIQKVRILNSFGYFMLCILLSDGISYEKTLQIEFIILFAVFITNSNNIYITSLFS